MQAEAGFLMAGAAAARTVVDPPAQSAPDQRSGPAGPADPAAAGPLAGLLTRHHAAGVQVARRSLASYQSAAGGGS